MVGLCFFAELNKRQKKAVTDYELLLTLGGSAYSSFFSFLFSVVCSTS